MKGCGGRPKIATEVESVIFSVTNNFLNMSSRSNSGVQSLH